MKTEWGSLFYKYIGKMARLDAKQICSSVGESVHLPIPRFIEENHFYKTHFGSSDIWLGISDTASEGVFESDSGHEFTKSLPQFTGFKIVNKHSWIENLATFGVNQNLNGVKMVSTGEWETTEENEMLDSFCVYNIIPEKCSQCLDKDFCRYKANDPQQTECVCSDMREGEFCEIDQCSDCLNGGYCAFEGEATKCVCPYPYEGENCEISKLNIFPNNSLFYDFLDASVLVFALKQPYWSGPMMPKVIDYNGSSFVHGQLVVKINYL